MPLTSRRNALTAASNTWSVTPASSSRILSLTDRLQVALMANRRGITRVSSPHRTELCASSMTRISVVPLRGNPPMKMSGVSSGKCSTKDRFWLAEPKCISIHRWRWLFWGHSTPLMPKYSSEAEQSSTQPSSRVDLLVRMLAGCVTSPVQSDMNIYGMWRGGGGRSWETLRVTLMGWKEWGVFKYRLCPMCSC